MSRLKSLTPRAQKAATIGGGTAVVSEVALKLTICRVAVWSVMVFALVSAMRAQEAGTATHHGYPQDWSQHHIIFTRAGLAQHPEILEREPRVLQQLLQRSRVPNFGAFENDPIAASVGIWAKKPGAKADWSQALQGRLVANAFPIKFAFYPDSTPDCTNDFVVFGLTNTLNANLVGLNNIYSGAAPVTGDPDGFCPMVTGPTVLFAYNITTVTKGHIITTPVMSLDGTQLAFVESVPVNGAVSPMAIFHVLTIVHGGTLSSPITPTMFDATLSSVAQDTHSSPWIDYSNDIVYVGTDDGNMHEITGVFSGSPTVDPSGSGCSGSMPTGVCWPVSVGANLHFSPPVLDEDRGLLIFGASDGNIYQINVASALVTASAPLGSGPSAAIVAGPVVDVTDGTTYAVTADDGSGAAIAEFTTETLGKQRLAELGEGASGTNPPTLTIYEPAFSNAYFNSPPGNLSGAVMTLCGTGLGDTNPYQYVFGFDGIYIKETALFSQSLSAAADSECSAWTEFYNPNIGGGTDYFFFGLTKDCTGTDAFSDGCVAEETNLNPLSTSATIAAEATINGGPSGIIVDGYADPVTYPQASSIYFTATNQQMAYKLTQNGLQ
jgi:hypothetical protein